MNSRVRPPPLDSAKRARSSQCRPHVSPKRGLARSSSAVVARAACGSMAGRLQRKASICSGRRRQADQIVIESPDEGSRGKRPACRLDLRRLLRESKECKPIDIGGRPGSVLDRRQPRRLRTGHVAPKLSALGPGVETRPVSLRPPGRRRSADPARPSSPTSQRSRFLRRRACAFRRHLEVPVAHSGSRSTSRLFLDVPRHDGRPEIVAALRPPLSGIQAQASFDFLLRAVAFEAPLGDQGSHLLFKEIEAVRGGCRAYRHVQGKGRGEQDCWGSGKHAIRVYTFNKLQREKFWTKIFEEAVNIRAKGGPRALAFHCPRATSG